MLDDLAWLEERITALTTEMTVIKPSAWAETKRYLPPQVTPFPGYFSFDRTPYLKEILDCLSVDSPVREVALMKSAQIGATAGILENAIGYFMEHVQSAPLMLTTADAELAQLRGDSYITPMIEQSGLSHLIRSADEKNPRKTGKTAKKIEWVGGGSLLLFGANNANKFRTFTARVLLNDEIDGWQLSLGRDGSPHALIRSRAATFERSRKVLDLSTPTIKGQSAIEKAFLRGDQRRYFIRCLRCGFAQTLEWRAINEKTGEVRGIVWETDNGSLVRESVRYLCANCGHGHINEDKIKLLAEAQGAEWRPTARSISPELSSYHLNALYSPPGMQSWAACVESWLEAWDEERNTPRDIQKLQVHYNNIRGLPFELRGRRIKFEQVSSHRRTEYRLGEIPNLFVKQACGAEIQILTCAVDVQDANLKVAVFGWARGMRAFVIDYLTLEGNTELLDDANTWGRLRAFLANTEYTADDGKRYRLAITLIDSGDGDKTDLVYRFCAEFQNGVFPLKGMQVPKGAAAARHFTEFRTSFKRVGIGIMVDLFKDRWNTALGRYWDPGSGIQPEVFFNAPSNLPDAALKELTVERKVEKIDARTGERIGTEWKRTPGVANELWDLLVYNNAALEVIAWKLTERAKRTDLGWDWFWTVVETRKLFQLRDR